MTPTQPKFIDMPFAYNGARNEIPATAGADDGSATLNDGFPTVTEQPISQGGIPPRRKDFNGILYALSNFQFFAQAGGIFTYDATLDYRTPAMVWYGGNLYICIKNNGASSTVVTPGTNSDYWKDFVDFLGLGSAGNIVANKLGTATVGSGTKPIWLNSGSPTASSSTVGSSTNGIWLNAGVLTACSGGGGGISEYKLATAGYVKFEIGLIIQWGNRATTGNPSTGHSEYTVTYPIKFTNANSYVIMKNLKTAHSSGMDEDDISFYNKTASTATTWASCKNDTYNSQEEWLAIGY